MIGLKRIVVTKFHGTWKVMTGKEHVLRRVLFSIISVTISWTLAKFADTVNGWKFKGSVAS